MAGFIIRRLLLLIPILLGVSILMFVIIRMAPGDPAVAYLKLSNIPPTPSAVAEARHTLGLDQPILTQYVSWISNAVKGDFGVSHVTRRPVIDDILHYLPATLQLAGVALLFTLAVSVPLGIWSARYRDRWPDHLVRGFAFLGVSTPNFWLGFLLVLLFSLTLKWLPPMGKGGWQHMIMPVLAVSFMSLAINARLLRASMLETASARHVLYARLRGLSDRRVERSHILRNAMLPIVTATGMHVGELLGGTLVIESVFGWPGIGRYAVSAIYSRDFPVIQCFTLFLVTIFVLCNLVVDILYAWLDPRIRLNAEAAL
jgi:nickel transport system permease protein